MVVAARHGRVVPVLRWATPAGSASSVVHAWSQLAGTARGAAVGLLAAPAPGRAQERRWRRFACGSSRDEAEVTPPDKRKALISGLAVTGLVGLVVGGLSVLLALDWRFAALAFILQWAFFLLHGWPQRSEKLYDASGSLTHIAIILAALTLDPIRSVRQTVLSVFAVIWCTRLGTFLFNRIAQDSEDTRFTNLKKNFWSFSIAWNLQVLWVFLLQLPIVIANIEPAQPAFGALDALGWTCWSVGFLVEAIADAQKFAFRGVASNKGRFITSGLWRYSRHPNYFGEILMWVGICISCSSCLSGWRWLAWLSPLFNALLLLFVSGVPMLEKAGEKKWGSEPEYRHYMENTSCVMPWFPAPKFGGGSEGRP